MRVVQVLDVLVELPARTFGGEAPIWHPQWALEEFWNFELPRDIAEERGYPQLTEQAKRKILGGNLARLHGMEVHA